MDGKRVLLGVSVGCLSAAAEWIGAGMWVTDWLIGGAIEDQGMLSYFRGQVDVPTGKVKHEDCAKERLQGELEKF